MTDLVLYKDKELKHPFVIEDIGDVEAGDSKTIEGWLANNTEFQIITISHEIFDSDVSILGVPTLLGAREAHPVSIKYAPNKLRIKPLDTFITFYGKKRIPPE